MESGKPLAALLTLLAFFAGELLVTRQALRSTAHSHLATSALGHGGRTHHLGEASTQS
jgi:hypothetical protein